jgi:hypothetical protein
MRVATLSRRRILLDAISLPFLSSFPLALAAENKRPIVGAIRWDAWYDPASTTTKAVEKSLSQSKYNWRAPFFAQIDEKGNVNLPLISQAEIDQEIRLAAFAGLDYWAFFAYTSQSSMSLAFHYYLSSSIRHKIRFCLFAELQDWGSESDQTAAFNQHLDLMGSDSYVTVEDGRPLYFLGFLDEKGIQQRWGDLEGFRRAVARFRAGARSRGLPDPYLVLAGRIDQMPEIGAQLGADALGAYALPDAHRVGSFVDLALIVQDGWRSLARCGLPVVPTVMAGWDRRPRVERPVPWETKQRPNDGLQYFFGTGSPTQIADQLRIALSWASDSDRKAPAVLIYAWNENDEGGWVIPTIPCDMARLTALRRILVPADAEPVGPGCIYK